MKLHVASLCLALSTTAAHIRSRRGASGTGCPIDWVDDGTGNCLPDGDDFAVTCDTTSMTITFNLNHLYEDGSNVANSTQLSQQGSSLGVIGNCDIDVSSLNSGVITAGLSYGNCMDVNENGSEISFKASITGSSIISAGSDHNTGADIHTGRVLGFEVECTVQSEYSVDLQTFVATRSFTSGEVNSTHDNHTSTALSDISFSMSAWLLADRTIQIDSTQPVNIGMPIIIQIESSTNVAADAGFRWYIETCTAEANSITYDIIKTDSNSNAVCGSSFLDVYPLADFDNGNWNPLMGKSSVNGFTSTDATAFVMKAFQFAETTDQEFTLTCDIKLCWQCDNTVCGAGVTCGASNGYDCISW